MSCFCMYRRKQSLTLQSYLLRTSNVYGFYYAKSSSLKFLSSLVKNDLQDNSNYSQHKLFNSIDLDLQILKHLDELNIGILTKRKSRVIVAKRINPNNKTIEENEEVKRIPKEKYEIPFPFKSKGIIYKKCAKFNEIPLTFNGNPPEVAIIGRSNVGKSTLLNSLVGFDQSYIQKASISNKPGETKHLTFYQLGYIVPPTTPIQPTSPALTNESAHLKKETNHISTTITSTTNNNLVNDTTNEEYNIHNKTNHLSHQGKPSSSYNSTATTNNNTIKDSSKIKNPALLLVDMPGYGFAFMSEEEKLRCHLLCLDYLTSNGCNRNHHKPLKRVVFLLDGRHGIKIADIEFLQDLQLYLYNKLNYLQTNNTNNFNEEIAKKLITNTSNIVNKDELKLDNKEMKRLSKMFGWKLQVVLTKCDLVDRNDLCRRIVQVNNILSEKLPSLYHSMLPIMALSALQDRGVGQLQRHLATIVPKPACLSPKKEFYKNRANNNNNSNTSGERNPNSHSARNRAKKLLKANKKASKDTNTTNTTTTQKQQQSEQSIQEIVSDQQGNSKSRMLTKDQLAIKQFGGNNLDGESNYDANVIMNTITEYRRGDKTDTTAEFRGGRRGMRKLKFGSLNNMMNNDNHSNTNSSSRSSVINSDYRTSKNSDETFDTKNNKKIKKQTFDKKGKSLKERKNVKENTKNNLKTSSSSDYINTMNNDNHSNTNTTSSSRSSVINSDYRASKNSDETFNTKTNTKIKKQTFDKKGKSLKERKNVKENTKNNLKTSSSSDYINTMNNDNHSNTNSSRSSVINSDYRTSKNSDETFNTKTNIKIKKQSFDRKGKSLKENSKNNLKTSSSSDYINNKKNSLKNNNNEDINKIDIPSLENESNIKEKIFINNMKKNTTTIKKKSSINTKKITLKKVKSPRRKYY